MHHSRIVEGETNPLGGQSRLDFYQGFMDGCVKYYGRDGHRCLSSEEERIEMTLKQPQEMQNFTSAGFAKIQAPRVSPKFCANTGMLTKVMQPRKLGQRGTSMSITGTRQRRFSLGDEQQSAIVELVRPVLEAWTGQKLILTSLYGFVSTRRERSFRLTLTDYPWSVPVFSMSGMYDEDWPIEVIGHDGGDNERDGPSRRYDPM
jgi:hypothetical protein